MDYYFHVGIVVEDIRAAMNEFSALVGVTWEEPHTSTYGDSEIVVAYTIEGPPYLELIQGGVGGPWSVEGGSRLDHIGYSSDDVEGDSRRFDASGAPYEVGARTFGRTGWAYHRTEITDIRLELVTRRDRSVNATNAES
jgi:predicted enzyme related to lactoylglutathione lyase